MKTLQDTTEKVISIMKTETELVAQEYLIAKEVSDFAVEIVKWNLSDNMPTDEYIRKESCKANGVDYNTEEDIYDAVRVKLWSDGAKWLREFIKSEIKKS